MINTKTKGELGKRIEYDVEHDLFHPQNIYSDEYITPTFVEYVKQLERKLEQTEKDLADYQFNYPTIKELEKENTELKAFKEKCKFNVSDICKDIETENNLTKAKELLAKWVELFKPKGGNIPPTPIQVETEQFISEVEK